MDALLEKSTEKVKKEEEERREVLTESIKNEAERAETHARLRHEVRIDIAEDAKVSWYFEMLDDVGKEMGRCSDGSETSKFSKTFPESNSTAPSNDKDDESESESESESKSESECDKGKVKNDDSEENDVAKDREEEPKNAEEKEWISTAAARKNRPKKKEEKKSARAMKKAQMKESVANKLEINKRLSHILRLADANYVEVVSHHKNAIEEIRRKTEKQVHELEKEATETKQAFEQFLRDECLNKMLKRNTATLARIYGEIAQTEAIKIEEAIALLATREEEIDDARERERASVENEREKLESDLEENETILRRLHVENSIHEDRLQRVVREFSAREKARRDRASILDRQTKDEYRALSEAKRQYERKFSEREHAAARLAWRNKDAAAKLLQQQQYEREYKVHAC